MKIISNVFAVCLLLISQSSYAQNVEIEINNTPSEVDDYLCWSPTPSRIRLVSGSDAPVEVSLTASGDVGSGNVVFDTGPRFYPSVEEFQPKEKLVLSLPIDGSWVGFHVAGETASRTGKDVDVLATDSNGNELTKVPVMVRVRKNADKLTEGERRRFLSALAAFHGHRRPVGPRDVYEKYAVAHGRAFRAGIHGGGNGLPLFLAWHRAFLLSLERELQAIDPQVALPYWRFDQNSSNLFIPAFMGRVTGPNQPSGTLVQFDVANPLFAWRMSTGGPLTRDDNPTTKLQDVFPSFQFDTLENIFAEPGIDEYQGSNPQNGANAKFERHYHNYAHVANGGWLGSGESPRDPVFFLLHGNVDRGWAQWQRKFDRFDPASTSSYFVQGAYPGVADPARLPKGSYADDAMWPWSQDDGASTPADPRDDWPGIGWAMPTSPGGHGPVIPPTSSSMVDFMSLNGGAPGHGFCYSNLKFER